MVGILLPMLAAAATTHSAAPVGIAFDMYDPLPATRVNLSTSDRLLPQVTIDVVKDYSATFDGVGAAMAAAAKVRSRGDSCTLFFSEGMHGIEMPGPLFNVSGDVETPAVGRLTIAGAGMLLTTLNLTTHGNDVIFGLQFGRLTFRDLTFARSRRTTTQGAIVAADETSVMLRIDADFPQISDLLADRADRVSLQQGLYIRRYRRTAHDGVQIVQNLSCMQPGGGMCNCPWPPNINDQVHFTCGSDFSCPNITAESPGVWKLAVKMNPAELQRYRRDIGDVDALVGIKIKHGGQAFYLKNGKDLRFDSVRWLGHSRGIVGDTDRVTLRNTRVDRDPDRVGVEALSTNGGGPQVSQGRHCHSTLSLTVSDCHSLGSYIIILLPSLSCFVEMTVSSPWATAGQRLQRPHHSQPHIGRHR
jgi:hypothetical protein